MQKKAYAKFVLAAAIFAAFTVNLYSGRLGSSHGWKWMLPINACWAALGCYVLSRRWVSSFAGSLFAGAVYGFGPFMLGLAKFHPTAGFIVALVPWLFCPAAFGHKTKWRRNSSLLVILPFLAIVLYFQLSAHYRLFPVSNQTRLSSDDFVAMFAPLIVAKNLGQTNLIGFYHIPTAALIMGCAMLLAARRLHIIAVFALGLALACCKPILNVSPIIWLAVPVLCCSVLIGAGVQGLALAGPADRKWLLAAATVMATLAITALFLATKYFQVFLSLGDNYARLFVQTAEMYVLGAVTLAVLFFIARAKIRANAIRWIIISLSIAIDILFGARFIVDHILH